MAAPADGDLATQLQLKNDLVKAFEKTLQVLVEERDQLVHDSARLSQELRQVKQVRRGQ